MGKSIYLSNREMSLIWDSLYATRGRRGTYTPQESTEIMNKISTNNPEH